MRPVEREGGGVGDEEVVKGLLRLVGDDVVAETGPVGRLLA